MTFAFVAQQVACPVNTVCRVLGVNTQWLLRPEEASEARA